MKEVLVNKWNLPYNSSLGGVPVMKKAGSQKTYPHSIKQTLTSRFEHRVMRLFTWKKEDYLCATRVQKGHWNRINMVMEEEASVYLSNPIIICSTSNQATNYGN